MSVRKVSHRPLKKYSIGDRRNIITIHVRSITSPELGSASFSETYDTGVERWANVVTSSNLNAGRKEFDGVDVGKSPTHLFVIRYLSTVTKENIIRWEGESYKILSIIDPEERHEDLELYARILGDQTLEANT